MTDLPIDLEGTWLDNDREVIITSGSSLTGQYVNERTCQYKDDAEPTTTRDCLTGNLSEPERLITGKVTVCDWGTGDHVGKGWVWTPMAMRVSADGGRLFGKYCNEGKPQTIQLTARYSKVELRLMCFIPSPAIGVRSPGLILHGGDDRGFDYDSPRYRTYQNVVVTVDPARGTPTLAGPDYDFGPSTGYDSSQGVKDTERGWWWRLIPGAQPQYNMTLQRSTSNSLVTVQRETNTLMRATFILDAQVPSNKLLERSFAPSITAKIVVSLDQTAGGPATVRVTGRHDGFPAYELYANGVPVFRHDPLVESETPWSTAGSGEWKLNTEPMVVGPYRSGTADLGDVEIQCPPW